MVFPTRSQFNETVFKQFFVLPDSIIYYISKNSISPKCYQKMVQTCKYFFIQNPIIIAELCISNSGELFASAQGKSVDMKNIYTSKLWITKSFESWCNIDLSLVLSKIYRFDGKKLYIWDQTISSDELLSLSSNVEHLCLNKTTVKYNDGSIIPLERIVGVFPKIKSIVYRDSPSSISTQTFKELLKIPRFLTLDYCKLWHTPEDFDIESFNTYMKTNKHTNFGLDFFDPLSEAYKNRLEQIIVEIIEDKNRDYKPPYIYFSGLNEETKKKMYEIYYR